MLIPFCLCSLAVGWDDIGYDTVSRNLNQQIAPSPDYAQAPFSGGKGILVRSPDDGYEYDSKKLVVPATYWTNDLFGPSQLFPSNGANGNPQCPSAPYNCFSDPNTGDDGPWNYAQMAVVIGSMMGNLMMDYDDIQSEDWGWGVFYSSDANAVDWRCRFIGDLNGYDCPGGWVDVDSGDWSDDPGKLGAGAYGAGNPYVMGADGGGGAGCHFGVNAIDQTNSFSADGENLIQDRDCQCNYHFKFDEWQSWVSNFASSDYTGPMSSMDVASCWVNNVRDMVQLQNALWWMRLEWTDGSVPWATYGTDGEYGDRRFWGWNEVPVKRESVAWPVNWDAVMIKLPPTMAGDGSGDRLSYLSWGHALALEDNLNNYVFNGGWLVPGSNNIHNRPGSYIVIVREYKDASGNYNREFFCESWTSPNNKYQIIYLADFDCCYVEWGGAMMNATVLI